MAGQNIHNMILWSHKILLDPSDFQPIYTLLTPWPDDALAMLESDKDIEFELRNTREVGWYGLRVTGLFIHVKRGARKLYEKYPPVKPQVDEKWEYLSALAQLPE